MTASRRNSIAEMAGSLSMPWHLVLDCMGLLIVKPHTANFSRQLGEGEVGLRALSAMVQAPCRGGAATLVHVNYKVKVDANLSWAQIALADEFHACSTEKTKPTKL